MPPRADTRGIGESATVSGRAYGGSATSAIPIEQVGDSDSRGTKMTLWFKLIRVEGKQLPSASNI
jgi:hypothetical protein